MLLRTSGWRRYVVAPLGLRCVAASSQIGSHCPNGLRATETPSLGAQCSTDEQVRTNNDSDGSRGARVLDW
jgi:hypothetical protein